MHFRAPLCSSVAYWEYEDDRPGTFRTRRRGCERMQIDNGVLVGAHGREYRLGVQDTFGRPMATMTRICEG